jgi:hypothetical protein
MAKRLFKANFTGIIQDIQKYTWGSLFVILSNDIRYQCALNKELSYDLVAGVKIEIVGIVDKDLPVGNMMKNIHPDYGIFVEIISTIVEKPTRKKKK